MNEVLTGDCLDLAKSLPNNSVDLIVTSPPYAEQRQEAYGGVEPTNYSVWAAPRFQQFHRILKPSGSLILNIKEHASKGERDPYVYYLIGWLRSSWKWVDEFIWVKPNPFPRKPARRLKDGWERCYHFTKTLDYAFYPDQVKQPVSDSFAKRVQNLNENDTNPDLESASGSGLRAPYGNFEGITEAYPSNVLTLSVETSNTSHAAAFPIGLPTFFINLLSQPGDLVLDPFLGSGTTCLAAKHRNRDYLGFEIKKEYADLARKRLEGELI